MCEIQEPERGKPENILSAASVSVSPIILCALSTGKKERKKERKKKKKKKKKRKGKRKNAK